MKHKHKVQIFSQGGIKTFKDPEKWYENGKNINGGFIDVQYTSNWDHKSSFESRTKDILAATNSV